MIKRVELVFFEGCPHADAARVRLREAMTAAGLDPKWDEWDTGRDTTPDTYRRYGSPTILLDGRDIGDGAEGSGMGCVVGGGPALATIVGALQGGRE